MTLRLFTRVDKSGILVTEVWVMAGAALRLKSLLEQLLEAELPIRIRAWDGSTAGPHDAPALVVRNRRAVRRLLWKPGELGLARAWVAGDLEIEGDFYGALKSRGVGFTVGILYTLARAANDIPAFRYRMRGDEVIEHEVVHPSTTVLSEDGLFGFCGMDYHADFASFAAGATGAIATAKQEPSIEAQPSRDDVLFTTGIPWVSFTSFAHPTHLHPVDCIPRIAWGKRFEDGGRLKMPLSVQGHHAMMDGLHVGQYYEHVQAYLAEPEALLSAS